jgi:hypothetical protein
MSEEDFIKVWSESSRESILHQFYWERKELREIIDKAIEYIENNVLTYIDEDGLESITDKEENELIKILRGDKE